MKRIKMKILHITTGQYFLLAPLGEGTYLLDTADTPGWSGVIFDISPGAWNALWLNKNITDIYLGYDIDPKNRVKQVSKIEFELVE